MGWSNDQATNLVGLVSTYIGSTITWGAGSNLVVAATANPVTMGQDINMGVGAEIVADTWHTPTFVGDFHDYQINQGCRYRLDGLGNVQVIGIFATDPNTAVAGDLAWTFPAGYRPNRLQYIGLQGVDAAFTLPPINFYVQIATSGQVTVEDFTGAQEFVYITTDFVFPLVT